MQCLLLTTEKLTKTNRIYPKEVVLKAINDPCFIHRLKAGEVLGQIGFPEVYPTPSSIDVLLTSHVLRDIYFEGNDLCGEIEILDNENGKRVRDMLSSNVDYKFRLRGYGDCTLNEDNVTVVDSLNIVSFNLVPSYKKEEEKE
jgi:hypothetical protein